jgi:CTP synthase (UTP-ammonia lyase)
VPPHLAHTVSIVTQWLRDEVQGDKGSTPNPQLGNWHSYAIHQYDGGRDAKEPVSHQQKIEDTIAIRIALIGDYDAGVIAHQAIPKALALAADGPSVQPEWLDTESAMTVPLDSYAGFWCVPASPYRSMEGALRVIRFAREQGRPFLGTCGGCQHAVLEFARNVLHISGAGHTEVDPSTPEPVITGLTCSLIEAGEVLHPVPGSRLHEIYGADEIRETYHCSYGLNPEYVPHLVAGGMRIGVTGPAGEARALELPAHPFFFVTLFQPERSALSGKRHPLVKAFVAEASGPTS